MLGRRMGRRHTEVVGGCGKRVFLTYDHAAQWAKAARRRQRTRITVYRCPACRSWHAGHSYGPRDTHHD